MMIHKRKGCRLLVLLFTMLHISLSVAAVKDKPVYYILTQQQWSVPRTAETILAMPAIYQVMNKLSQNRKSSLLIRYPGGEVGMLWASELKGWLVSLGLASADIKLQVGSLKAQEIELSINKILN